MQIIEMKTGDLIPYENNPRRNEEAVEKVAASIREFGFKVPIIVDKDNVIVAGHTRLKAAELLGLETVPVIKADDLTEEQIQSKRKSLEGVLVPITSKWNEELFRSVGFKKIDCFWRYLNFAGWLCIK